MCQPARMVNNTESKAYALFYAHVHCKVNAPRSRETYLRWVQRLAEFYQPKALKLEDLSEREVLDYLVYLREDCKLAVSTLSQALVPIRMLYRDVLERDWKLWRDLHLKGHKPLPSVLTTQEVTRVLAAVDEDRFRAFFSLVYHCGLRLSEALQLKPTDIDSARGVVRVRHGKGDKAREVPICSQMIDYLRRFWCRHKNRQWLFPGLDRHWKYDGITQAQAMGRCNKAMSASSVQVAMQAVRKSSGIHKPFTVHTLRHSFATHLLEQAVSIRQVSRYLGHSDLNSTLVYLHVTELSEQGGRRSQSKLFDSVIASALWAR